MSTKIDKRKNNWIIAKNANQTNDIRNQIIVGLLVNNSWNNNSNSFEITHFNFTKQE